MSKYHGLLLVNKPTGCTSHDVVSRVRKIFQTKEVGHSGTLDPLASGLMVLLLGEATKLSSYITEGHKCYRVDIKLGVTTDTLDTTGIILTENLVQATMKQVIEEALKLTGEMKLPIPLYSAKKIDGKKLYEYARENEAVLIPEKKMIFWGIQNRSTEQTISFEVSCSKGSFIRSWVKLLGEKLGCGATMSGLVRLSSHQQTLENALDLENLSLSQNLSRHLISINEALPEVKKIKILGQDLKLLKNGQISHDLRARLIMIFKPETDQYVQIIDSDLKLVSIVGIEAGKGFSIRRVFN